VVEQRSEEKDTKETAMSVYNLALFIHILGAFGLIATLAVEAVALRGFRTARDMEAARGWLGAGRAVRIMAPASIVVVLIVGLYLTAASGGGKPWILIALLGLILIAVIGGVLTGTRMARIASALEQGGGSLSPQLVRMLQDPVLVTSAGLRTALVIGILFLMTTKPSLLVSLIVLVIAAGAGLLAGQIGSGGRNALGQAG
jgi:hypothetical protein